MITVAILINGHPLVARTALNQGKTNRKGETKYKTDSGRIIWHKSEDGAIDLAHKLLEMIENEDRKAKGRIRK